METKQLKADRELSRLKKLFDAVNCCEQSEAGELWKKIENMHAALKAVGA